MSEERKNKRDKLTDSPIIFTENDHFSGEIESGFQHVGGNNKKKLKWPLFFLVGHNSSSQEGSSSVEYSAGSLMSSYQISMGKVLDQNRLTPGLRPSIRTRFLVIISVNFWCFFLNCLLINEAKKLDFSSNYCIVSTVFRLFKIRRMWGTFSQHLPMILFNNHWYRTDFMD